MLLPNRIKPLLNWTMPDPLVITPSAYTQIHSVAVLASHENTFYQSPEHCLQPLVCNPKPPDVVWYPCDLCREKQAENRLSAMQCSSVAAQPQTESGALFLEDRFIR